MYDELARNAIDLLEEILDEQLEHEPEVSHRLVRGLNTLLIDASENRLQLGTDQSLRILLKTTPMLFPNEVEYL